MSERQTNSYARYADFEGPSEEERTAALRKMRRDAGFGGNSVQGGGRLMFGTPRKGKCRDSKVEGLRIK